MEIFVPIILILMALSALKWQFYVNGNDAIYDSEQAKYRHKQITFFCMLLSPFISEVLHLVYIYFTTN